MISIGGLDLTASEGGAVRVEILEDDFPEKYPFLNEPQPQRVPGLLSGEPTYGQLLWIGIPVVDGMVEVEVTEAGNKAARFQWSSDGGESWDAGAIVVPLGGSVALGSTGLSASFSSSPAPEAGTSYTFSGPGAAARSGVGPDVTITGSGSIDGAIEIQTAVGTLRYRVDGGLWSTAVSMASLPFDIEVVGVSLDIAPEDALGLELAAGARFEFYARGRFHLRLTRGDVVETYTRLRVGDPLWFVNPAVPASKQSKLLSAAEWVGTTRPPLGYYSMEP